jgi:D-glycero-alpha-D-manno-heptose-7-phosphate kinase
VIIVQTPMRVSFFGGGSDLKGWYSEHGGVFLSCAIQQYSYVSLRKLPPFFEHKHRIVYRREELVAEWRDIQHPVFRALVQDFEEPGYGFEIHNDTDLPSRTGLGTSSSFCVGLLNAFAALKNIELQPRELAMKAVFLERERLGEAGGIQDQIAAAEGGLGFYRIAPSGHYRRTDVIPPEGLQEFCEHWVIIYSGESRFSMDLAQKQVNSLDQNHDKIGKIVALAEEANGLFAKMDLEGIGRLLGDAWAVKRDTAAGVSTDRVNQLIEWCLSRGAWGCKLLGAGGGGFVLAVAAPLVIRKIREELDSKFICVPGSVSKTGSRVLLGNSEWRN